MILGRERARRNVFLILLAGESECDVKVLCGAVMAFAQSWPLLSHGGQLTQAAVRKAYIPVPLKRIILQAGMPQW